MHVVDIVIVVSLVFLLSRSSCLLAVRSAHLLR